MKIESYENVQVPGGSNKCSPCSSFIIEINGQWFISQPSNDNLYNYVPLCVGGSKVKAETHLKYYPENRDTFEMYPGKVMHIIGG